MTVLPIPDDVDIGKESVALANKIEAVCHGHSAAAGLIAIGMVLGHQESLAEKPDLPGLFRRLLCIAAEQMSRERGTL